MRFPVRCHACARGGLVTAIPAAMLGIRGAEHSSGVGQGMTSTSLEAQGTKRSQSAQHAGALAQKSSPGPEAVAQQ